MRRVMFFWFATRRFSGWRILICLVRQLSEVDLFQHENSEQKKGVFAGIVDDTRSVEFTL